MIGVNFYIHRFGTFAIFATLFVALYVNGVRGCVFDFEHPSDFELDCNDAKGVWSASEDVKDSPSKKVLILAPEEEGCLRTKESVVLNATTRVTIKFYSDAAKNDPGKIHVRLVPTDGSCTDEECAWDLLNEPQFRSGEWITAEHKFPLNSMKAYYVQVQVDKSKGKFLLDHISVPSDINDSRCHLGVNLNTINLSKQLTAAEKNSSKSGSSVKDICRNLLITSASALTLNNLLN